MLVLRASWAKDADGVFSSSSLVMLVSPSTNMPASGKIWKLFILSPYPA